MTPADGVRRGAPAGTRTVTVRVLGAVVALAALALCARALVSSWPEVRGSLASARPAWLALALAASAGSMLALAVSWWRCLRAVSDDVAARTALGWYFAGELGKYVPGGVWAAVGRGELAARGAGLGRAAAYGSVAASYAAMCVAAALVCGVLGPVVAMVHGPAAAALAALLLVPAAAVLHPRAPGLLARAAGRVVRRPLSVPVTSAAVWVRLVAWGVVAWLLLAVAAVAVTAALGLPQDPARVAAAAVAAWVLGFVAVPVPAGAGVRELAFVVLCGLPAGPAVAVAVLARVLLVAVDAAGGVAGVAGSARHAVRTGRAAPTDVP